MTTVAPVTTTSTPPTTASQTPDAMQALTGNFNTFLTLLTTQLKNQDPTSPMDSNQFTQQLVEFSQVEQQINTNDNLKSLISQGQNQTAAYAVGYLGKNVTVTNGQAALVNGAASWNYTLDTPAAASTLAVTNSTGQVVFTQSGETGAGSHNFAWNGQDMNGSQLPDGTYTLNVAAQGANGSTVTSGVSSTGKVTEVDMSGSAPELMIGSMKIPLSDVSSVGSL